MKLENIKVINISGVARNCRDEKSNAMHNFIAKINIFTAKGGGVNAIRKLEVIGCLVDYVIVG